MILFKSHPLNDFYLTPSIKNYNQIVEFLIFFIQHVGVTFTTF